MKRSSLLFGALCALALGASTAQAQNKLTTIFASNNGLSGTSMVFFDVTVANPVRLTGFELNSYATVNAALNLQVYTCASTYVGNETNAVRLDADRAGQRQRRRRRPGRPLGGDAAGSCPAAGRHLRHGPRQQRRASLHERQRHEPELQRQLLDAEPRRLGLAPRLPFTS
jgi:hypothetical protein